jgi:flagellar assembly factor FliW
MKNNMLTELDTRFGKLTFNPSEQLNFSEGIIGFPHLKNYALMDFPTNLNLPHLKLLHSLEDKNISFITLLLFKNSQNLYSNLINQEDILQACETLNMKIEDACALLILNIKKDLQEQASVFANLKAPVFVDLQKFIGSQHIFTNSSYEISKKLEM